MAAAVLLIGPALADDCANPEALGTARTLEVDPAAFGRIGTMQYRQTLPLAPKEVVLTFDDGPMPPMTTKVLEVLRSECIKATFFLVGRNAKSHPAVVRQIALDGHTVANHTQNHPLTHMGYGYSVQEFDAGFRTIAEALAPDGARPAPFARFPGLFNVSAVEQQLNARGVSVFSADFLADDWLRIPPNQILARALARLEQKGFGILLLHDVQPGTALILPKLIQELKARGYRIVHMVPASGKTVAIAAAEPASKPAAPAPAKPTAAKPAARKPAPVAADTATVEFSFVTRWRKYYEEQQKAAAKNSPKIEYFNVADR